EERNEDALWRRHVLVHQQPNSVAHLHGCQQTAGEITLGERLVAVQRAITLDQAVDIRIIERAHNDAQRVSMDRMDEGPHLPRAQMCGEKHYALTAALR